MSKPWKTTIKKPTAFLAAMSLALTLAACSKPPFSDDDVRQAVSAKLAASWAKMAHAEFRPGKVPQEQAAEIRQVGAALKLSEMKVTNFRQTAGGLWEGDIIYFVDCLGSTPQTTFRARQDGHVFLKEDGGVWVVDHFEDVVGRMVSQGTTD